MTTTTSQAATNGYVTVPSSFDPYLFKMLRHCHPSSKSSIPYSSSLTTNELILQHALAQSYYNHSHTHASSGNSTINHNSSNSNTLPPNVAVTKSSLDYVSHYQSPLGSRNNSLSSKLCSTTPSINSTTSTNPMTKTTTTNGNWEEYCTKSLKSGATKETWDQWLQPPLGAVIQGPSCIQADKSGEKSDTTLCGMFNYNIFLYLL
ncbi:unnamed protein product [Didymodactylos carnosus]|uniref:Uncharacterized protein n=1 Tax=Didymodactylos carnosus TaxID=1234261 RepID=A0A8S2F1R3_9BILA|nr:unnamed protein product [Didymodactylos carnosus]CAF4105378.1 unnamed protein product [Didymodactylos carnosus]